LRALLLLLGSLAVGVAVVAIRNSDKARTAHTRGLLIMIFKKHAFTLSFAYTSLEHVTKRLLITKQKLTCVNFDHASLISSEATEPVSNVPP
jgi:hypothetical protein